MRFTVASFIFGALLTVFTGPSIHADAAATLFESIRSDDPVAVAAATVADNVNTPDQTGTTPLMYAVLYSRPAIVELLMDRGAAINATNTFGSTALMWAAPRPAIVRLLLRRGVAVNAKASDGTTALVVAARVGNVEAMQALVAAGADMKSPTTRTGLLTAMYVFQRPGVREYLASQQVRIESAADLRGGVLALQSANQHVFEELLAAGVDPRQEVPLVTLSIPTYFVAARQGQLDAMRALEKAGVDPKTAGGRGWTALMLAAGDDAPSIPVMQHLLASGVDVNARDEAGRTALDWALTRGETAASELLRRAGGQASPPAPAPVRTAAPYLPKEAVARAIARLQPAGPAFSNRTQCNSCHNQSLPAIAVAAARRRVVAVDETLATHSFDITQQNWRGRRESVLLGDTNQAGFQGNVQYGLLDMAETGAGATPVAEAMVLGLATRQTSDGSWPPGPDIRPPLSTGAIVNTALALRGIRHFSPPGRRAEMELRVSRAAGFLRRAMPTETQEHSFKLLGLLWAGAAPTDVARQREALVALQRADGGWAQLPSMSSDAYATGQALFALHAAGMAVNEPVYRKAVDYLLKTQLEDGTWFVRTRAFGFQPYFETGFPYGRSQFISTAATSWAATALAYALSK
jgi:ankyrin repeat protein